MDAYVSKPVNFQEVIEIIEHLVEKPAQEFDDPN
jgi:YesN/AraC family two-component response regulator